MGPEWTSDPVLAKEIKKKFAGKRNLVQNKKAKPSQEKLPF